MGPEDLEGHDRERGLMGSLEDHRGCASGFERLPPTIDG
jgi:hypothetical protein